MSVVSPAISATDLEAQLEVVRASAAGENEGIFGPRSVLWRVDREAALFLGAGRALLLQLAHPWVAAGVSDHSTTLNDPIGRFHRTFEIMFTLVFGNLDQALAAARRLHRRHQGVTGALAIEAGRFEPGAMYIANDPAALMWVHATLVDAALMAHDLVMVPLTSDERETYYQECRLLGGVFGLSLEDQPANWDEFCAYTQAMVQSDTIVVTPHAKAIAERVLSGAGSWLRSPPWYRALTTHLLPEPLRAAFGYPYTENERLRAERAVRWLRRIYPILPPSFRWVGPYQEAVGGISGQARPSPRVRGLNRLWIGRASMARSSAER